MLKIVVFSPGLGEKRLNSWMVRGETKKNLQVLNANADKNFTTLFSRN